MIIFCPYCMSQVPPGQFCPNCGADPDSYRPSSHHFPMGHLLHDRYLVGKVLGEGGFGITYLGLDTTLDRRVAVKEYFPNVYVHRESSVTLDVTCYTEEKQALYEKGRDQFLLEARVLARLDTYPEIVRVYDFFPANNTAYIVMELLTGKPLHTLMAQQGRIPAKYLLGIMEPVLRTMDTVHRAGIIHRDISPDNIMILDNGQVKLLDFGCARDIDREHTMTVMLKHGFAPIEQYTSHNQGPWTDVYALCATFYHCLTGQMPPRALERMTAQDPLIPPNRLGAALTPEQEQALMRGLAVEPQNRWQSMAELHTALYQAIIKDSPLLPEDPKTEFLSGPKPEFEPEREPDTEFLPKPEHELEHEREPEPEKHSAPRLSAQKKKLLAGIAAGFLVFLVIIGVWRKIDNSSSEASPSPAGSEQNRETPQNTEGPAPTPSPEAIAFGDCGANVRWTLDSAGLLTISGTGPMKNYELNTIPWINYRGSIKKAVIESGITSIGNWAFYSCRSLTSVSIPDSVSSIGKYAFYRCSSLTSVTIPDSVSSIGWGAFDGCSSLTSITHSQ